MAVLGWLLMVVYLEPESWRRSGGSEVRVQHDAVSGLARFPFRTKPERRRWPTKLINWLEASRSSGVLAMHEEPTTTVIQRYLDALPGDTAADPIIRELLERAVGRLRLLCST